MCAWPSKRCCVAQINKIVWIFRFQILDRATCRLTGTVLLSIESSATTIGAPGNPRGTHIPVVERGIRGAITVVRISSVVV